MEQDFNPDSMDATLSRIIANQTSNQTATHEKLDRLLTHSSALEQRVSALERWRYLIIGGATALGALVHVLVDMFRSGH